jgi:hypothetical protein
MTYQGHKNWNHWNVSLWINNDEGLYRMALEQFRQRNTTNREAAQAMLSELHEMGLNKTPDGAPYSVSSIMGAMADYE